MKRMAPVLVLVMLAAFLPRGAHADELPHDPDARRVLFTGDSITQGMSIEKSGGYSYRYFVWKRFESAGTAQSVDFVGNMVGPFVQRPPDYQDPPSMYAVPHFDYEHAGVAGAELCRPAERPGQLPIGQLMAEYDPDVLVAAWGLNDLLSGTSPEALVGCYDQWLKSARAHNPNVDVVVARLPWTYAHRGVAWFNSLLTTWARTASTPSSKVVLTLMVDSYTVADTYDGLHPTAGGERKIARMMASGLRAVGLSLVAEPVLTPPATPGLVVVRQGRYIVVKWSARARATSYVVRCRGVDRRYYSALTVRYSAPPSATSCRVRATNKAGTSPWSGAVLAR